LIFGDFEVSLKYISTLEIQKLCQLKEITISKLSRYFSSGRTPKATTMKKEPACHSQNGHTGTVQKPTQKSLILSYRTPTTKNRCT